MISWNLEKLDGPLKKKKKKKLFSQFYNSLDFSKGPHIKLHEDKGNDNVQISWQFPWKDKH